MKKQDIIKQNPSEIVLYQAEEGKFQIALTRDSDSIWLNLNNIAELYQTSVPNISMHVRNILKEGELDPISTVKNFLTVQTENNRQVRRNISFYSLDMILSPTGALLTDYPLNRVKCNSFFRQSICISLLIIVLISQFWHKMLTEPERRQIIARVWSESGTPRIRA